MLKKRSKHWEVVEKTPFGERRLGVVKASSSTSAANKLSKSKSLPSSVTVYPVKVTKEKKSSWF